MLILSHFPRLVLCLALSILCCVGCSIQGGSNSGRVTALEGRKAVPVGSGIYVAMPTDFQSETGSGKRIQTVLMKVLEEVPGKRAAAPAPFPLEHDLRAARDAGCSLLLTTRIVDWQDPPAALQIKPDRGEVRLSIYETEHGELLRVDAVECSGTATTVNLIGSKDPGDCLKPSLQKWREALGTGNSSGE